MTTLRYRKPENREILCTEECESRAQALSIIHALTIRLEYGIRQPIGDISIDGVSITSKEAGEELDKLVDEIMKRRA